MALFEPFGDAGEGFRIQILRVVAQRCWAFMVQEVEAAPPEGSDGDGNDGAEEGVTVRRRVGVEEGETE